MLKNGSQMADRHEKFSSIGKDLTDDIFAKKTYKTSREISSIIVHCSFSPQFRGDDAYSIDKWHQNRFKTGIGYHYVVLEDGTIQKGRWADYSGAHAKGFNAHSLGICRIGGMSKDGEALRDATNEQINSIRKLTHLLVELYDLSITDVKAHNELPHVNKSCPLMNMNLIRNIV